MNDITPRQMIDWLDNIISQRERVAHSADAAKMEKAIRDYIRAALATVTLPSKG